MNHYGENTGYGTNPLDEVNDFILSPMVNAVGLNLFVHMSSSSISATMTDGVAFFRVNYNFDSKILNFLITLIDTVTENKMIDWFMIYACDQLVKPIVTIFEGRLIMA